QGQNQPDGIHPPAHTAEQEPGCHRDQCEVQLYSRHAATGQARPSWRRPVDAAYGTPGASADRRVQARGNPHSEPRRSDRGRVVENTGRVRVAAEMASHTELFLELEKETEEKTAPDV